MTSLWMGNRGGLRGRGAGLVGLVSFVGAALSACVADPLPPSDPSCALVPPEGEIVASLLESGGIGGGSSMQIGRPDGSLDLQRGTGGIETMAPAGSIDVDALRAALRRTEVFDAEQGCYPSDPDTYDALGYVLAIERSGRMYLFSWSDGSSVPDALFDARAVIVTATQPFLP